MPHLTILFSSLIALAILLAIAERRYALANERRILAAGGSEVAPRVFRLMVPVYVLVFPAAVAEHLLAATRPPVPVAAAMVAVFLASKALKLWAVAHLREGWTMKVILPPALRVVTSGPYRYLRHPNYVAVMGEITALPLAGGAFVTAAAAGALFLAILAVRVRTEEAALMARPEYARAMGGRRRFLPRRPR